MITTFIVEDTVGFRNLEPEWNELLQNSPSNCIFLTWEWMYTWWLHLSGSRKLHIIVIRQDGQLIGIAPLALCAPQVMRLMPFHALEFIGSGNVGSDYLSLIVRKNHEQSVLPEFDRCLTQSKHMLELVRVKSDSALMQRFSRRLQKSAWKSSTLTTTFCPYASISGHSWESYLQSVKKGHRKYLDRKTRKLHKDFMVEVKTAETEAERRNALACLVQMHLARWSLRDGSTAFNKQSLINFHEEFSKISLHLQWLKLHTLTLNGNVAAVLYAFRYNNIVYYYQTAFNAEYEKYSVGMMVLSSSIKAAIEAGCSEYDFLHDEEPYKYLWTRERRELIRYQFYPPRAKGRVFMQFMNAKSAIRPRAIMPVAYRETIP